MSVLRRPFERSGAKQIGCYALAALLGSAWIAAPATPASAQAQHPRPTVGTEKIDPKITGYSDFVCRLGFDTRTAPFVPPDDITSDNPPANLLNFFKGCRGPAIGTFTAEVLTPAAGDFIHIDMRATCVKAGGTDPCTVGQQVFASPGHTFLRNTLGTFQTHSMQMVWPDLQTGRWKYEVLLGGNGNARVDFRTFTVMAFTRD